MRTRLLFCLVVSLAVTGAGRADEAPDAILRALDARVGKATREAGPGIVCLYVSRSDAYHKAPYWGVPAKPDAPGQLGRFDAAAARKAVPADARNRTRILRSIAEHDLSDLGIVPESYGSGVVIDRTGLVLTNAHVVRDATRIYVRIPGKRGSWANIHASDRRSDLAVLRLLDPPADLKALTLGDGGNVRRGQFLLSLANEYKPGKPGDDGPTVSWGTVTELRRKLPGKRSEQEKQDRAKVTLAHYGTLLRMDARTTPGCSGGALLDLDGKVIGMTTALAGVASERPGGFAIPFDSSTRRIIDVLKRGEEVEYGFLGVTVQSKDLGRELQLADVLAGSPAHLAGLQAGDQVVSINGVPLRDNNDLFLYISIALAGNTIRVEVSRSGGFVRTYPVKLTKYYVPGPVIAARRPPAKFGLRVDYTSILSQRTPFFPRRSRPPPDGVVVREVLPGSPADKARLQPDKVITHVDGRAVHTPAEYYERVARAGQKVELTFLNSEGRAERITLKE